MIADDDVRRYRQAAEDALEQLDWCIGYLHGTGKRTITRQLARNRAYIRRNLMRAPAEPVPSDVTTEGEMCATRNRRRHTIGSHAGDQRKEWRTPGFRPVSNALD